MANFNKVFLMGNLTRDPELKFTAGGAAICTFDIAVNREWKDKSSGEKKKEVGYFRINVWGATGENCSKFLAKGRPVFVEGRLQHRTWTTEDGQKRSAVDVVADTVQFMGGKPDADRPPVDDLPPMPDDNDIPF